MLTLFTLISKFIAAVFVLIGSFWAIPTALKKYRAWKNWSIISQEKISNTFVGQFNKLELEQAISGYVNPHCSPVDPTNRDGDEFRADTRESAFSYFCRNIKESPKAYHLLLADTGMGKTSFCINFYLFAKKSFPEKSVALISLASGDAISRIGSITTKSETILILDALDEDPEAINEGRERLFSILKLSADFRAVIITCRSQYFLSDDHIPYETPLPVMGPKKAGQSATFHLTRSYLTPFNESEISKYISKHFPLWKPWKLAARNRAEKLAKEIPDLAYRPMLLERLPELATTKASSTELFDLYDHMVEGWIKRESRWISPDDLRSVSYELALFIYKNLPEGNGRISPDQIEEIAKSSLGKNPSWKSLTSRSLLNRDSLGRYKFSHRSILEFLIVKLALFDVRGRQVRWTEFMKDLFISWGHSNHGKANCEIAHEILTSEDGRKNISPIVDSWAAPASFGVPDFKRCTKRLISYSGRRLAPATWRSSSMTSTLRDDSEIWAITDHEFGLDWNFIDRQSGFHNGLQIVEIMKVHYGDSPYHLPSYDQFICFVEGVYHTDLSLILPSDKFVIADGMSKTEFIFLSLSSNISGNHRIIDKDRKISTVPFKISTFRSSLISNHGKPSRIKFRPLWLVR